MKKLLFCMMILAQALRIQAQTYGFSAIDSVLDTNASTLRDKVIVMLRHNGKLVYDRGIGMDSSAQGQIASMTKTLAAALILRLAQEGLLGLDDSLGGYYPRATIRDKGGCTVRQNFSQSVPAACENFSIFKRMLNQILPG